MRYTKLVLAAVLSLSLFHYAAAQPPGPPRGPGFGPPMGPPGGGFDSIVSLLELPEVQKEIGLQDTQRRKVEAVQNDFRKQVQGSFRQLRPGGGDGLGDPEKTFAEMRGRMEKAYKKSETQLQKLLTGTQWQRLNQLRLQRMGATGLLRPEVVKTLDLSEQQRSTIREIQERHSDGFGPPEPNPQAMTDALAVLTKEQNDAWSKLIGEPFTFPEFNGPPGFRGGPGGFGPGGPMRGERKILNEFDKDGDKKLNVDEREAARAALQSENNRDIRRSGEFTRSDELDGPERNGGAGWRPPPGFGFGPGFGGEEPGTPGPKVSPSDVTPQPEASLYDANVLRTLFLDFENSDWENELVDFHGTDVDIPATLTVDGKKYFNVGVHFRGMSSYGGVRNGSKRSLNVSLDLADEKQRLYGYKTLNLLNAHEDSTFMHTVLYSHIARKFIPAPKANFVKVVINGESWGIYVNVQQFDKVFIAENFQGTKGPRWKVRGSPGGGSGLNFIGEDLDGYKRRYELKSNDDEKAWKKLIALCQTLSQTPIESLEKSLEPMLDIDATLWFLALDNALINCDGYWIRASDYSLFCDDDGRFHLVPHDMNEAFQAPMGPGMGFGSLGQQGSKKNPFELDPLIGLNDNRKPLRSRLLAVPTLRARYLEHIRAVAEELDWSKLGPVVAQFQSLIEQELEVDTRKLTSFAAFKESLSEPANPGDVSNRSAIRNLRAFAQQRHKYLVNYVEEASITLR
jgi:hypothetical protein